MRRRSKRTPLPRQFIRPRSVLLEAEFRRNTMSWTQRFEREREGADEDLAQIAVEADSTGVR